MKEKLKNILDILLKYKNLAFPVFIVVLTALTVVIALGAGGARQDKLEAFESSRAEESTAESTETVEVIDKDTPLVENTDGDITELVTLFFNARATGDEEALRSCHRSVNDTDMLRWIATAKYTDSYPVIEIYTKPGFNEQETIAYVYYKILFTGKEAEYPGLQTFYIARDEDGKVYFKNTDFTEEMNAYIEKVSSEADVADLRNNSKVEYDELMIEQPELLAYLQEIDQLVGEEIGIKLGQLRAEEEAKLEQEAAQNPEEGENPEEPENPTEEQPEVVPEPVVLYVVTTDTVNVRKSDSTKSDILGSAKQGSKYKLIEKMANGWTKIEYNGGVAYINSKYLKDYADESANSGSNGNTTETVVGKVTAKGSVNVRKGPSTNDEKIGILAGGETVESYGETGEWTKVNFQNKVGYIKSEYLLKSE